MQLNDDVVQQALDRDGYAILKGIFSVDEVTQIRKEVNDLLATAPQRKGLYNGRNLGPLCSTSNLARQLLDERVSWGDFMPREIYVHANTYNGWHVDGQPLSRAAEFTFNSAWMYKAVLYLQDHTDQDGFSVVPGSHKQRGTAGTALHLSTRAGDIVVFHHSLRHAGRLPNPFVANFAWGLHRLRLIDDWSRQRLLGFNRFIRFRPAVERFAIFFLFVRLQEVDSKFKMMSSSGDI